MANTTLPAWALKAAQEINEGNYPIDPLLSGDSAFVNQLARIIYEHAPDAEALAGALEKCIEDLKSEGLGTSGDEKIILAAYRAAHPRPDKE